MRKHLPPQPGLIEADLDFLVETNCDSNHSSINQINSQPSPIQPNQPCYPFSFGGDHFSDGLIDEDTRHSTGSFQE